MLPAFPRCFITNRMFTALPRAPRGAAQRGELLEAPRIRVVPVQVRPGLEHRVPIGLRPAHRVRQMRSDVASRHQRQRRGAVDRRHEVPRQHQHRKSVRVEGLERPVRHEAQMAEQRPVEHRSKPGLAEQVDHLIEADAVANLHIELWRAEPDRCRCP